MRRLRLLALAALAVVLVAAPAAAGPNLVVGAAENAVVSADPGTAATQLGLATAANMNAIRIAVPWSTGQNAPDPALLSALTTTAQQASVLGVRVYLELYPSGPADVPGDDLARADFTTELRALALALPQVRDFVIGSQVNNPAFWSQDSSAAGSYVALLAASYDALKGVDPGIQVIGGSLASQDAPGAYVLAMGKAYRASGRTAPLMDAFAIQPSNASSGQPPTTVHSSGAITIGDYARLVATLKRAFRGTAQSGATLPIVYDGYGVQTQIPPEKAGLYTATENDAVPEATQGDYYQQALQLAACQPNVTALLFQHTVDERDLTGWQSGLYYPDLTQKSDFGAVAAAIAAARETPPADCPGAAPPPTTTTTTTPTATTTTTTTPSQPPGQAQPPQVSIDPNSVAATIDCTTACYYLAVLQRAGDGAPVRVREGEIAAKGSLGLSFAAKGVPAGDYTLSVHVASRWNPGKAVVGRGAPVTLG